MTNGTVSEIAVILLWCSQLTRCFGQTIENDRANDLVITASSAQSDGSALIPITAAALAPDGQHLVTGSQGGCELRSWPAMTFVQSFPTSLEHIHDLQFSNDGHRLLIAGGSPSETGRVEVWNPADRKLLHSFDCHGDVVYQIAVTADGTKCITTSGDGQCCVIGSFDWKVQQTFSGHSGAVLTVCVLNENTVASSGIDHTIRIWNIGNAELIRTLDNHVGTVNSLALRPESTPGSAGIMASASEDLTVRFWQPTTGRLIRFARLESTPHSLVWSPSGDRVFVGCRDGAIRSVAFEDAGVSVISLKTGHRIHELLCDEKSERLLLIGDGGHAIHLLNPR